MKKQLQTLLIILSAALFFTACEKDETPELWTISGEILMQDAQVSAITSPLANVEIYLLNFPFTVDSITDWVAESDILKTTQTDANGLYSFSELQAGDYIVMPVDSTKGYNFSWSESPDSIWTSSTNSKSAYTMNFTTPKVLAENSSKEFAFTFNNNWDKAGLNQSSKITICRKTKTFPFWFSWNKANWKPVKGIRTLPTEKVCSYTDQQTNDNLHKYYDEYKIEFSKVDGTAYNHWPALKLLSSIELTNPVTNNIIDITWTENETTKGEVRTNNE